MAPADESQPKQAFTPDNPWRAKMLARSAAKQQRRQQQARDHVARQTRQVTCTQIGERGGPAIPLPAGARVRDKDGLTPLIRRFCELHALQPDPGAAMRLAYWELGGSRSAYCSTKSATRYLKLPAVQAYLGQCRKECQQAQAALARFLPQESAPDLLAPYRQTEGQKFPFTSPAQLLVQIDEYARHRTEEDLPVSLEDMSQWLGLSFATFRGILHRQDPAWKDAYDWARTLVAAWWQRHMLDSSQAAYAGNQILNRMGFSDRPEQVAKIKAETQAIREGKMGELQRPVQIVMFAQPPERRQIESVTVTESKQVTDGAEQPI